VAALVGPNGSGKSTLLRGLARLHHLDAGLLRLGDGRDAYALLPRAFAREVTMLAQNRPTPSGLAVRDVVGFGRHPYRARLGGGGPGGAAAVDRSMRLTGVADIADRAVDELSGGQLQRVWLACCLAQATGVLLLDEPTTCPRRGSGRSRVPRSPGPGGHGARRRPGREAGRLGLRPARPHRRRRVGGSGGAHHVRDRADRPVERRQGAELAVRFHLRANVPTGRAGGGDAALAGPALWQAHRSLDLLAVDETRPGSSACR